MNKTWYIVSLVCISVIIYGFVLRPLFSNETLRDETITLLPGQTMSFDMRLTSTSRRELIVEYEVLSGNPITILVAEMGSTQRHSNGINYIPSFTSQNVRAGTKKGLLPKGMWSVLLSVPPNLSGPTNIKVKTQLQRPKFFTKQTNPIR